MKEAMLYSRSSNHEVGCFLCAHRCQIAEGRTGVCQVRENQAGTLYTLVYGRIIARQVDPVEKKPLFHFYPGSTTYSIAAPGCNFRCPWCQNADISQSPREGWPGEETSVSPEEIVAAARQAGCRSIAYTYTEPTVSFEFCYDIACLARATGLANIFVTNGYMTQEMLAEMYPYLDAANVDLKAFRDETYRRHMGARLQPVLDSLKEMKRQGIWLEVTTLLVPGKNDDPEELRDLAQFLVTEIGSGTPWHLSRFFPAYKMADVPPTPLETIERAREIALAEGLRHVYLGNVPSLRDSDTICPSCGHTLLLRRGFVLVANDIQGGTCPDCGAAIAGVWLGGGKR